MAWTGGEQSVIDYFLMSFWALCGSVARAAQWRDATGKVLWSKIVTEIATALFLGEVAIGACAYFNIDSRLAGAIAGFMGYVGPAVVAGFFTERVRGLLPVAKSKDP